MAKRFSSYSEMVKEIMWAVSDAVPGSEIGVSSKSISHYIEVSIYDEDDEYVETRRVRISDHDAVASCGGNIVHEVDLRKLSIVELYDDCNEFVGIEVADDWAIGDMVDASIKALAA